jgi:hypothetical protein
MLLLKLDFQNVYDMINLSFFFQAMSKLGIPDEYLKMTKALFQDAKVSICLNGSESSSFQLGGE